MRFDARDERESSLTRSRRWKARSKNAPLRVWLSLDTPLELVPLWGDIIRPDIARWATIGLWATGADETPLQLEDIEAIWNDLNHASQLTILIIRGVGLQPEIKGTLPTPCILNLSTLEVHKARPPLIEMPALQILDLEDCSAVSEEDIWNFLTRSSHLEKIRIVGIIVPNAVDADPSRTYYLSMLPLQNLDLVGIEYSHWEGQNEFFRSLLLIGNRGSLKGLALRGMGTVLKINVRPSLPYLTTLLLTLFPYEPTASQMVGLLVWLKQAHVLKQLTFNPGTHFSGFTELLLQMLLIPQSDTSNIICPSLNLLILGDNCAPASVSLPSLLLRVVSQRREFLGEIKSTPDDNSLIPLYPKFFCLGLHVSVMKPLLGDAKAKEPSDTGLIHGQFEEFSVLQNLLDDSLADIGGGEFDVDSLSQISDHQKRLRELCSLLDIRSPTWAG